MNISIVSGGFDPIHSGHIDNITEAATIGPVIVILNSDEWLARKKGSNFMDWYNRAVICQNIKGVMDVIKAKDDDDSVCESLKDLKRRFPEDHLIFCKGGDRVNTNTPESKLCYELGIEIRYSVGGGKTFSSRDYLKRWSKLCSNMKEGY